MYRRQVAVYLHVIVMFILQFILHVMDAPIRMSGEGDEIIKFPRGKSGSVITIGGGLMRSRFYLLNCNCILCRGV